MLVAEQGGSRSAVQLRVFEDPWQWDHAAAGAHQAIGEAGGKVAQAMPACEAFLGNRDVVWPGLFLEARP